MAQQQQLGNLVRNLVACLVAAGCLCGVSTLAMEQSAAGTRVRGFSTQAKALIVEGLRKSPTICSLVTQLEQSDVILYVHLGLDADIGLGRTQLLDTAGETRFLRVEVSARLAPQRRLEILGHELQHVAEIASMPDIRNSRDLAERYAKLGWQVGSERDYETDAARQVELRVKRELGRQLRHLTPGTPSSRCSVVMATDAR